MTDRELLELAAKAAGIEYTISEHGSLLVSPFVNPLAKVVWNPLTDDGDALRLAVVLHMFDGGLFMRFMAIRLEEVRLNPARSDEEIARRAIVRAAAEIGKAMT